MPEMVEAEVTLRVPRDGEGTLHESIVERLAVAAAVDAVESFDTTDVRPELNALRVQGRATFSTSATETALAAALTETMGIERVDPVDDESRP